MNPGHMRTWWHALLDAIYDAGFGSSSRLYENTSTSLGMTPRAMRSGGEGQVIRYATAASPLGRMLVAATDRGVCSIVFGKDDDEIVNELNERFPNAELRQDQADKGWLAEAVSFTTSQMTEHPLAATFPRASGPPEEWTIIGQAHPGQGVLVDGRSWNDAGGWEHFAR